MTLKSAVASLRDWLNDNGENMINQMTINGVKAVITYDSDIDLFRGEFIGLNGGADFYAADAEGLRREGAKERFRLKYLWMPAGKTALNRLKSIPASLFCAFRLRITPLLPVPP